MAKNLAAVLLIVALAASGFLPYVVHGGGARLQQEQDTITQSGRSLSQYRTCSNGLSSCLYRGEYICVNMLTSAKACGSCGTVCGSFQKCDNGNCVGADGGKVNECFPAHALALLPGGQPRRMDQLALGDSVAVQRPDGSVGYEPIYGWGHKVAGVQSRFVQADLLPAAGGAATTPAAPVQLEMTPGHFAMTVLPGGGAAPKRASDLVPGDRVLVAPTKSGNSNNTAQLQQWVVAAVRQVQLEGLYSPYTLGGNLLVNGALVSAHSMWYADALFDALGLPSSWLPALYQATLAPARALWHLLGRERYMALHDAVDARVGISDSCSEGLLGFLRVLVAAVAILVGDAAAAAGSLVSLCVGVVSGQLLGTWTSAAAAGAVGAMLLASSKGRHLKQG